MHTWGCTWRHTWSQVQPSKTQELHCTRSKSAETLYSCGICGAAYCDETEEPEYWTGCDSCNSWFHGTCINVTPDSEPEKYFCNSCASLKPPGLCHLGSSIFIFILTPNSSLIPKPSVGCIHWVPYWGSGKLLFQFSLLTLVSLILGNKKHFAQNWIKTKNKQKTGWYKTINQVESKVCGCTTTYNMFSFIHLD